jgi:hypothetical protein
LQEHAQKFLNFINGFVCRKAAFDNDATKADAPVSDAYGIKAIDFYWVGSCHLS